MSTHPFVSPSIRLAGVAILLAGCESLAPVAKPNPALVPPPQAVVIKPAAAPPKEAMRPLPNPVIKVAPAAPIAGMPATGAGTGQASDSAGKGVVVGGEKTSQPSSVAAGGRSGPAKTASAAPIASAVSKAATSAPLANLSPIAAAMPARPAALPANPPAPSRAVVRQRELDAAKAKAKLALAAVPDEVDIPDKVTVKMPDNAELRDTWNTLQGEWEQSGGGQAPDCVEGGYTQRTVSFGKDGILTICQQHGPDRTLTRTMDFILQSKGKMRVGKERKPDAFLMTKTRQTVHGASGDHDILPPSSGFPADWDVSMSSDKASVTLDGKTYRRVK